MSCGEAAPFVSDESGPAATSHIEPLDIGSGHRPGDYTVFDFLHRGLDRLLYGHVLVDDKVEDGIDNEILALGDRRGAPALPIRKSVTPDYIISLEEVRKLKS